MLPQQNNNKISDKTTISNFSTRKICFITSKFLSFHFWYFCVHYPANYLWHHSGKCSSVFGVSDTNHGLRGAVSVGGQWPDNIRTKLICAVIHFLNTGCFLLELSNKQFHPCKKSHDNPFVYLGSRYKNCF